MLKYIEEHWKRIFIIIAVVTLAVVLLAWWQRSQLLKNSTETKLSNQPRRETVYLDSFYFDQLSEREQRAYAVLEAALDELSGGVVVFPEALNGREYTRITHAIEYGRKDYFYALVGIPMTAENLSVTYKTADAMETEDAVIEKCVVFLSCANDVDKQGDFDEDGYVLNIDEMEEPLGKSDAGKVAALRKEQEEIEAKLNEVVAKLPKEYGEKEAVDYFLDWMHVNIYPYQEAVSMDTMSGLFEQIYKRNGLSCLLNSEALPTAYAKLLSELCNRAGINAHVVLGQWRDGEAYVITCVRIGGDDIYIDASGGQDKDLWGQKYLTKQEASNVMAFENYFSYGG